MEDEELNKLEEELLQSDDSNDTPPSDVIAFNEMRSCADLLRLYSSNQLEIKPDFQRDDVWSNSDKARFIDSLTKGLPIPSMCISLDSNTDKRLVIDGLQRIQTIIEFLSNDEYRLAKTEDIDERLRGKTTQEIKRASKTLFERVENTMIPINLIRCDYTKEEHMEYLYTIFYRLNSGGMKLNNQEIRNCIYTGTFNTRLKELANEPTTLKVIGENSRFKNQESILRLFAFYDNLSNYRGRLSSFLNNYMSSKVKLEDSELERMDTLYTRVINILSKQVENDSNNKIKSFSRTALEGLIYGIAKNIDKIESLSEEEVSELISKFSKLPEFSKQRLKEGLSSSKNVESRLKASEQLFSKV